MYSNTEINDLCTYAATLLFTSSKEEIEAVMVSTIDTEASLLSELSLINNDIQDSIEFNCSLIVSEYIDYLKDEIGKIISTTMDFEKAPNLVDFTARINRVCQDREEMLFKNMAYVKDKISTIIRYDIAKSTELKPISQSKTTDFILSTKERISSLNELCSNLINAISQCSLLSEACSFAIYYKENVAKDFKGTPPLLEEKYETIIAGLSAEYSKWKGELDNVKITKNNI